MLIVFFVFCFLKNKRLVAKGVRMISLFGVELAAGELERAAGLDSGARTIEVDVQLTARTIKNIVQGLHRKLDMLLDHVPDHGDDEIATPEGIEIQRYTYDKKIDDRIVEALHEATLELAQTK